MTDDTIAAISTPIGEGGIAIVRVSGPNAFDVADAVFVSKLGKPSTFPTHTIHFGRISDNGNSVDQVMLCVMRAPRTFTAEDTIEINCHGGILNARSILSLCLRHGARLAEPGEFTKRAFLNGRIDLTQAEAVMDLIHASTSRAHAAATHSLEGHLSRGIRRVRESLLDVVAQIEAHIDFPEDEIDSGTRDQWLNAIQDVLKFVSNLLSTVREGKVLRHGLAVTIIGRPNVGKSSLMNALLGEERTIVTPIPGTTRDTIEEHASIRGIPVKLTDTAGLRKARGAVEAIGIRRSHKSLTHSDLLLHVLDGSRPFSVGDRSLLGLYGKTPVLHVVNKSDLPQKLKLPIDFAGGTELHVSAARGDGLDLLKQSIESIALSRIQHPCDLDVVVNERQAHALRRAEYYLTNAVAELRHGISCEIVSQSLREGLNAIGEVSGQTVTEDILSRVFSKFCIGK
jgi:tRNA modification GTPase